jgi:23S rRNA (adenine2503-C2)-methyltransferase
MDSPIDPYDASQLDALLADEPAFRRAQVRGWLVRGVDDPAHMTDLPSALRARLAASFDPAPAVLRHSTADGGLTHKVLLQVPGGEAVESVLMLYPRSAERQNGRATVCISTQAGCAMGCPFCDDAMPWRHEDRHGVLLRLTCSTLR